MMRIIFAIWCIKPKLFKIAEEIKNKLMFTYIADFSRKFYVNNRAIPNDYRQRIKQSFDCFFFKFANETLIRVIIYIT